MDDGTHSFMHYIWNASLSDSCNPNAEQLFYRFSVALCQTSSDYPF